MNAIFDVKALEKGNYIQVNLGLRVLSDVESRVLEKGLDYAPMQNKIN